MAWPDLTEWWISEVRSDPAYQEVVTPLLHEMLSPITGKTYLDLGAGEGRVMKSLTDVGAKVHGVDLSPELASLSQQWGPAVVGALPDLRFVRADSYDGAYAVLVLEHLSDHLELFKSVARVVRSGGVFALVSNHPVWTAPGSTPITDDDGEVLWRPGDYFSAGVTAEPAGADRVLFHHRSMASLLNAAADAGWTLEKMTERPHHELDGQEGIPRLLACRWLLLP